MYYIPAGILVKANPTWVQAAASLGVTPEKLAVFITPVPGGVGAVTTSVLAKHVIRMAKSSNWEQELHYGKDVGYEFGEIIF